MGRSGDEARAAASSRCRRERPAVLPMAATDATARLTRDANLTLPRAIGKFVNGSTCIVLGEGGVRKADCAAASQPITDKREGITDERTGRQLRCRAPPPRGHGARARTAAVAAAGQDDRGRRGAGVVALNLAHALAAIDCENNKCTPLPCSPLDPLAPSRAAAGDDDDRLSTALSNSRPRSPPSTRT